VQEHHAELYTRHQQNIETVKLASYLSPNQCHNMPQTLNDIDYVKWKDPRTKTSKDPPPEPWALPLFEPLQIDDYYDPGEAAVPSGTDRHDPMALFRLFFDDKMLDQIAMWTNTYAEAHPVSEKDAPLGKQRS
jgi:hypothetical protein